MFFQVNTNDIENHIMINLSPFLSVNFCKTDCFYSVVGKMYLADTRYCIQVHFWVCELFLDTFLGKVLYLYLIRNFQKYLADTFFKKLCRLKPALNFALSKLGSTDFKYETYPLLISTANGFYKLVCLTLKIELETNDDYVQILNNKDFLLYISELFCIKIVSG